MTIHTHGHHESVLRSRRWRTLENSAAYLSPHLSPDFHVLDIGCGPGTITADLASRVTHVTAVEHTSAALDLARAEMEGRTNVSYVVTDAHALDLPDDSFDVVHAHQVLQHVHDPVQAGGTWRPSAPYQRALGLVGVELVPAAELSLTDAGAWCAIRQQRRLSGSRPVRTGFSRSCQTRR